MDKIKYNQNMQSLRLHLIYVFHYTILWGIPRTKGCWSIIQFIQSCRHGWMTFYYCYQSCKKKDRQYHSYKKVMFLFCTSCLLNKTPRGEKILISVQKRFQAYLKLSASGFFQTIISVLQASASMQRWNKNNPVIWFDLVIKFSLKENKSQNEKFKRAPWSWQFFIILALISFRRRRAP